MKLISLVEYAKLKNKEISVVRRKAIKGHFETAVKIGRNWVISVDEPYIDKREKNNKI